MSYFAPVGDLAKGADEPPIEFDWDLGFTQEQTECACAYWRSRLSGRTMPSREDLDPVAMRKFSSHVGLVEVRRDERGRPSYFIRRAGTRWEDIYGPMTGRYLHEFLTPSLQRRWNKVFDAAHDRGAPVCVRTKVTAEKKDWLSAEMFLAPLGQDGEITMLFICFVAWLPAGAVP